MAEDQGEEEDLDVFFISTSVLDASRHLLYRELVSF